METPKCNTNGKALPVMNLAYDLQKQLRSKLPDNVQIHVHDDGAAYFFFADGNGFARCFPRGANVYDTFVFRGKDEPALVERQIAAGLGKTIEFVFTWMTSTDLANKIEKERSNEPNAQDADWQPTGDEAVDEETVYDFFREFAKENGNPDDVIKNKSLYDLSGIVVKKAGPVMPSAGLSALTTHARGNMIYPTEKVGNVVKKKDTAILAENVKTIPMPNGKVMVFTADHGAVIVDAKDIEQTKTSWVNAASDGMRPVKHSIKEQVNGGKVIPYSSPQR